MLEILVAFFLVLSLLISSYTDFKKREVPDYVSYGMIFLGLGTRFIYSLTVADLSYFVEGLFGFLLCLFVALVMYYAGQWGGGDSKVLMGIGAFLGLRLQFNFFHFPQLVLFFINLVIISGIYGVVYSVLTGLKSLNKVWSIYKKNLASNKKNAYYVNFFSLFLFVISVFIYFFLDKRIPVLLISFAILITFFYYFLSFITSIEKISMIKKVSVNKLTEGDWLAEEVKKGKKLILKPNKTGLTTKQIKTLQKYHIKFVKIKQGIPFVPNFLISYLAVLIFGNWLINYV